MDNSIDYNELRYVNASFVIDTNLINAKNKCKDMNCIEKWWSEGIILLHTPETTFQDLVHDKEGVMSYIRKCKARERPIILPFIDTKGDYKKICNNAGGGFVSKEWEDRDRNVYQQITQILLEKDDTNTRNDINIVYCAWESCCILVTNDGGSTRQPKGILGNADKLKEDLGIIVMNSAEAVKYVDKLIKERDESIRHGFSENEFPEWLDKDCSS